MSRKPQTTLRRGWTTGACATAATKAALLQLWGDEAPGKVHIVLPRGERPEFEVAFRDSGEGWAEAGIVKDAGDDPDVTHGALIKSRVSMSDAGVKFRAGEGVGTVTMSGLPVPPGEPAINPVPRQMMVGTVNEVAARFGRPPNVIIRISVPGGEEIARNTWNSRLGIRGGLSILGTTGIVRPFSCAAWIASIHRGIDVARAEGLRHVAGCTGATSEKSVQNLHGLPDEAMLDMGDFAGGMLKYLARHPVPRITVGGGIGKMAKLAQGAMDLHSGRSRVDMGQLAHATGNSEIADLNSVMRAYEVEGGALADWIAENSLANVRAMLPESVFVDTVVVDRQGTVLSMAGMKE
ncbi:MAG: cobalt-precorrin-5B (C(1))-methyltransferase [Roseovarius sp.]|nr:cobalt-precorrin-5B (C(1))-methyltransferase [Roseovarius sp.]MCY4206389.1 cobalt-precorrin-5B (C(1))-methyltransferase [Roseovarius sp.]MCY4314547.1 cobalt-precorrin-5B (C(1))-methyltransferase [Roseovarius sp.]